MDNNFTDIDVLRLVRQVKFVVDPFQFHGHKHEGDPHIKFFRQNKCNPKRACTPQHRRMFADGISGDRLLNPEEQEQMAKFLGQFQKSIRSFRSLHASAFMHIAQRIHRETVFADLIDKGQEPMYLGIVDQEPFYRDL